MKAKRFALRAVLLLWGTLGAACSSFEPESGARRTDVVAEEVTDADSPDALGDGALSEADAAIGAGEVSFKRDIRPLMDRAKDDPTGKGCKSCHYSTEANHVGIDLGGLDLTTLGTLREGGGSTGRRIVVATKPNESGLIQKLKGQYPYGA